MNSESVGGILGAIVGSAILVVAIAYGPIGQIGKPQSRFKNGAAEGAAHSPATGQGRW